MPKFIDKTFLILCLFSICIIPVESISGTVSLQDTINIEDLLNKYRNHPFQWVFPEYFYKAEIIRVEKENKVSKGYSKIEFFGLSACIPSQYTYEIKRKNETLFFKSKTGDAIIMIKSKDSSMLCSETNQYYSKDYCSAFSTAQEFDHKLFTLTPDTAQSMGDKWIVHGKGVVFEKAKKIEIYSADMFKAYVLYVKDSLVNERKIKFSHEITLFHSRGPLNAFITISFLAKDDTLLKHFVSTIE